MWCSRRRGAGTAMSTRPTRPATGSTSSTSRSSSSARRCSSSPIRAASWSRSPRADRRRCAFPSSEALGPGRDAKTVEIAKDVMPTIALHLIRQPKGGRARDAEEHDQQHLCGGRAARRASPPKAFRRNARASATWSRCRAGTRTRSRRRRTRCVFRVSDEPLMTKLGLLRTAALSFVARTRCNLASSPARPGDPVFSEVGDRSFGGGSDARARA